MICKKENKRETSSVSSAFLGFRDAMRFSLDSINGTLLELFGKSAVDASERLTALSLDLIKSFLLLLFVVVTGNKSVSMMIFGGSLSDFAANGSTLKYKVEKREEKIKS